MACAEQIVHEKPEGNSQINYCAWDQTHLLQQDILLYWVMGGERIQRKLKKFRGKQLAGKCTEPERNNKERGSEWKQKG